jgi:hypothetical protein
MLRALLIAAAMAAPGASLAETRLMMLDQAACEYCALWDKEVGAVYAKTAEGRQAPLLRHRIYEAPPGGVSLARPARYTPTFVLLNDGLEVGRIEGYPGEDFFYGLLQNLLKKAGQPAQQGEN